MAVSPLLGPVVALVVWTVLIMIWMAVARQFAFRSLGPKLDMRPGFRGSDLEGQVDPRLQWAAHNYNHLMEQPTIFYAIVFALILMHFDAPINVWIAWVYVGLRVVHSIVQVTVNIVRIRGALFGLSSLCIIALTTHAALRLIIGH